jgi:predicted ester cyclase
MSIEKNKQIIRRYLEEIVNTGNTDKIESFISPDYVEVYEGKRYPLGIKGAREHIQGVRQTYPDLKITIERQIAEGEWVVTSIVAHGTHRGVWLGIKPTGKALNFTGVNIDRVINGRIVEHGGAANMLEPLLGVGAIKIVGPE